MCCALSCILDRNVLFFPYFVAATTAAAAATVAIDEWVKSTFDVQPPEEHTFIIHCV